MAPSGYGKSPVVREIQRPIFALEQRWYAEYQEALNQYNFQMEQRRLTKKDERAALLPPPAPPGWKQLIVDDTTTEALTDAFSANPRGILWNRDELAGLLLDLDKYAGKDGGTKSRLMSSYDSGAWKVNRRSRGAYIRNATLSIFGTIQPKALPTIFSDLDAATGFLPRFIFVSPTRETPSLWTDETVSTASRDYLTSIVKRLLDLDFDEQGEPVIIGVGPRAKRLYEAWFNEQVLEPWRDIESSIYEAVLAKLRGQCQRLALILHCLEAVDAGRSDIAPVSEQTMEKATLLANCFKAHQRNAWQSIVNQDKVAELPTLYRQVARAILSLEGEIEKGMIATTRIKEQVNTGLDPRFHVSAESIGKAAKPLGFDTRKMPDGDARGFFVTDQGMQKLKIILQTTVRTVRNVQEVGLARVSGNKSSGSEVSEAPETPDSDFATGRFGHLPDTCETSPNPHEHSASDTSDGSDTCFYNKEEKIDEEDEQSYTAPLGTET